MKIDIAFVCVPTPNNDNERCDISYVKDAVENTIADVIVIKSTIPIGTTEELIQNTGKNIVFSPEHYGTTQHCEESPNFLILGGDIKNCNKVANLYYKVKNGKFRIQFTDSKTAELSKYMLNSFLALKVTFCCEFADIAKQFDISYPELREIFIMDERVGNSHTFVYEDAPYYNSHCFNKDIPALINFAKDENIEIPLITEMDKINKNLKNN